MGPFSVVDVRSFLTIALFAIAGGLASKVAVAADPITLSLGGRLREFFYAETQTNTPAEQLNATGLINDGRIAFQGRTVLDNGITVRAYTRIFVLGRSIRNLDVAYAEIGSGLGKFRAGEKEGANGDIVGDAVPEAFLTRDEEVLGQALKPRTGITVRDAFTFRRFTGEALGIAYESPEIAGFKIGVSYHPELSPFAGGAPIDKRFVANNAVDVSAAFSGDYPGGTYRVAGGYFRSQPRTGGFVGPFDGNTAWNLTAGLTYGGWELSGGYIDVTPTSGLDESAWTVGALYAIGPFKISGNYFRGRRDGVRGARQERVSRETLQGAYKLAPGVTLGITGFHADQTDAAGSGWDGTGFLSGIKLVF